ncbi:amidohydrolase family protein [Streptomyces sp. TM32]|uniref:amidohydrolase family protein n=1 Tax=Streptomyces sp. TM32 TaxID=1652669 RepID=UPI001011B0B9|nr:amidohydrolase family protein [Streptomyces sp. TM32]RXS68755.1 amidohydrolase family protein [Streptomyces sp. TM32]
MLITAGLILTPDGNVPDGAVLITGDTITAAGPRAQVEAQAHPGEPRLSFPDSTIMPGLIDAHVHLCFDASADVLGTFEQQGNDALYEAMRERAQQLLSAGVTTVRDLGDRDHLVLRLAGEIAQNRAVGPRIISAGTPVTPVGGHCWFLGGEVTGIEEIRALVRRNAEAGAKVIKVMETGGGLTKGGPKSHETQFSPEELTALVQEAHQAGLPVAAHAHGADGIAVAVGAGVDTLEHCTWMTAEGIELRQEVLAQIVEKGIYVCPTTTPHWPMLPKVFGQERANAIFGAVREMAEAGARLVAATDAGVQRAHFGGLASSLTCYEHLGLPPGRILEMATAEAARALGLGDRVGQVAAGYSADLLVLDGNPLEDLGALRRINTVVARGMQQPPAKV